MAPNGGVFRRDSLERAPLEVRREDDVDDVLGREAAHRRDRIDDRDRALDGNLVGDSHLLRKLAMERADEALARVDSTPRQQPVLAPVLLVAYAQGAHAPPP